MTTILLAQINPIVGNIDHNTHVIIDIIKTEQKTHDIIVFPELAITGYPPEDLLLYPAFIQQAETALQTIAKASPPEMVIIVGCLHQLDARLYNSAAIIRAHGIDYYHKQSLPNYGVFDEARYFSAGQHPPFVFEYQQHRFVLGICEDLWQEASRHSILMSGAQTLIAINASPYEQDKHRQRQTVLAQFNQQGMHVLYLNQIGGQDELIFDGQSLAIDAAKGVIATGHAFQPERMSVRIDDQGLHSSAKQVVLEPIAELYHALCLGLRDFLNKNKLSKVVLGLSGGIDSALCLSIAADSLGPENVHALIMPSIYSAKMSAEDAILEANALGVAYQIHAINDLVMAFDNTLPDMKNAITAQNIQARIRGMLLMAYANEHQAMVLSTSNKSETAVGYCTLYGDMCGGLAILKDVYKTDVYALAQYRNTLSPVIPANVITRPPSAELAPSQKDEDDLPPYALLDAVLKDMLEKRLSIEQLLAKGYDAQLIQRLQIRLKSAEFKRFQAAPGLKVSAVGFGKDWRMPISNHWFNY